MVLLYLNYLPGAPAYKRRLDGICRFAKSRGWGVAAVDRKRLRWRDDAQMARDAAEIVRQVAPLGAIVECYGVAITMRPEVFGDVPAVFVDPPIGAPWRRCAAMRCDEAAVASAAFRELSAGSPDLFAAASSQSRTCVWANERVAAFRKCCREAGARWLVFPHADIVTDGERMDAFRRWAASLPRGCAVFAVNDITARVVAESLRSAGRSFPRDFTIVGADSADTAPANPEDAISSLKIDFEISGYLAAKRIADILAARNARSRKGLARSVPFAAKGTVVFPPLFVMRRESTRGRGARLGFVMRAMDAIRREACDGLTVARLVERLDMPRRTFDLRFREAMGHSALEEILDVRMQRAFDLLARPQVPIGAIAAFCGFGCDYELAKLFRARTGITMRQWRKNRK